MATALSEYEKYLKTVAQGQKDTAKAQLDERQRQLQLAAEQNERSAHEQLSQAKSAGTINAEQRRILDTMTGLGGSGAAVQHQINAALSTDSATGKIHEALARARTDLESQKAADLSQYNVSLLDIDNQVKAALEKARYEQLVAAAEEERKQKAALQLEQLRIQQETQAALLKEQQEQQTNPKYQGMTAEQFAKILKDNYTITDPETNFKTLDTERILSEIEKFSKRVGGINSVFRSKLMLSLGLDTASQSAPMSVAAMNKIDAAKNPTTATPQTVVPTAPVNLAMMNAASPAKAGMTSVEKIDAAFDRGEITAAEAERLLRGLGYIK